MEHWWDDANSGKACLSGSMFTVTPTLTDLGSNPGFRCEQSETKLPELSKDEETTAVKGVRSVIGLWCQEEFQVLFLC